MAVDLSSTYFELFGLADSFQLDLDQLDERYRELQRRVHPDRFVNATDSERRLSMQHAAKINEGYRTLKDPLRRGYYLLEQDGYDSSRQPHTTSDSGFLMEQMRLREALDSIRAASDPFASLSLLMDRIEADLAGLIAELGLELENNRRDNLEAAADILMKMQFFSRLKEEAMELEAILEDELA